MTVEAIETDSFLAHPPEVVWAALTDRDRLGEWLAPNDFEPEVGHRFTFDMGQWGTTDCEVLTLEPPRTLSYSWRAGTLDTVVAWRLEPEGRGTRLFLRHDGFDLDDPMAAQAYRGMSGGWVSLVLPALSRHVAEVEGSSATW